MNVIVDAHPRFRYLTPLPGYQMLADENGNKISALCRYRLKNKNLFPLASDESCKKA